MGCIVWMNWVYVGGNYIIWFMRTNDLYERTIFFFVQYIWVQYIFNYVYIIMGGYGVYRKWACIGMGHNGCTI